MDNPAFPIEEKKRIKKLHSLNILDTPSEERFDRLTRLATHIFNVPIALVSLVDTNRQWFKSCVGLDAKETPRDISFCGHAILGDEVFIIPDTMEDVRFSDNPLVINEPKIRFYAGCPLKDMDENKMGTLCIIDTEPKFLNDKDISAFKDLAQLAERELVAVQLATLDELTKISNRRGFITLAQKSLDLCCRQKISASLVYFDLDNFKPINDSFGHAEGDKALSVFANNMKETFRDSDVFARLGGDEFVVLLTNTEIEHAKEIILRFRESINKYNQEYNNGYDISFSDGVVNVDCNQDQSIEKLLSKADALMYEKKERSKIKLN